MTDTEETVEQQVCGCVLALVICPVATLTRAAVFQLGWEWFVHPLGVPMVGIWHACGLLFVAQFLKPLRSSKGERNIDSALECAVKSLVYSGLALASFWLAHSLHTRYGI